MRNCWLGLAAVMLVHAAQAQSPPPPCSSAEAKQFEFWVGNWELTWKNPDGTPARGANRVESLMNGCVTHENFEGAGAQ